MKKLLFLALTLCFLHTIQAQNTFFVIHNLPESLPINLYVDSQPVGDRLGYFQSTSFELSNQATATFTAIDLRGDTLFSEEIETPNQAFTYIVLEGIEDIRLQMVSPDNSSDAYLYYSSFNKQGTTFELNDSLIAIEQGAFKKIINLKGVDTMRFTESDGRIFEDIFNSSFYSFDHFLILTNQDIFLPNGFQFYIYLPDGTAIKLGDRQKIDLSEPIPIVTDNSFQFFNNSTDTATITTDNPFTLAPFAATPFRSNSSDSLAFKVEFKGGSIEKSIETTGKKVMVVIQENLFEETFAVNELDIAKDSAQNGVLTTYFYHGVQDGSPLDFSIQEEVVAENISFNTFSEALKVPSNSTIIGIRPSGFPVDLLPYSNDFTALDSTVSVLAAGGFLGSDPPLVMHFVMENGTVLNVENPLTWSRPRTSSNVQLPFTILNLVPKTFDFNWNTIPIARAISQFVKVPAVCLGDSTGTLQLRQQGQFVADLSVNFSALTSSNLMLSQIDSSFSLIALPDVQSNVGAATFKLINNTSSTLQGSMNDVLIDLSRGEDTEIEILGNQRLVLNNEMGLFEYNINLDFWKNRTGYLIFSTFEGRSRLFAILINGGTFEIFPNG